MAVPAPASGVERTRQRVLPTLACVVESTRKKFNGPFARTLRFKNGDAVVTMNNLFDIPSLLTPRQFATGVTFMILPANANERDEMGRSPLQKLSINAVGLLTRFQDLVLKAADELLLAGADMTCVDADGLTPFHKLCTQSSENTALTPLLVTLQLIFLDHCSLHMLNSKNRLKETLVYTIASAGHDECLEALLNKKDTEIEKLNAKLAKAKDEGDLEKVRMLKTMIKTMQQSRLDFSCNTDYYTPWETYVMKHHNKNIRSDNRKKSCA